MEEIKPCPWCKSENVEWVGWAVECEGCMATGPYSRDQKEGIKLWNTRDWEKSQATLYPSSNDSSTPANS